MEVSKANLGAELVAWGYCFGRGTKENPVTPINVFLEQLLELTGTSRFRRKSSEDRLGRGPVWCAVAATVPPTPRPAAVAAPEPARGGDSGAAIGDEPMGSAQLLSPVAAVDAAPLAPAKRQRMPARKMLDSVLSEEEVARSGESKSKAKRPRRGGGGMGGGRGGEKKSRPPV